MRVRPPPRGRLPLLLLLLLLARASAFLAPKHFLGKTFTLHTGRATACPRTVSYGRAVGDRVPASQMTANGARCLGPGAKHLRAGSSIRPAGLRLPTLVQGRHTRFFAGVESATRVCGGWAFNASSVSWFVASSRPFRDAASGVSVEPDFVYAAYTHFAHLCLYRTPLDREAMREVAAATGGGGMVDNGGGGGGETAVERRGKCFPGCATVETRSGSVSMRSLRVGEEVLVAPGVYSRVYAFSHRSPSARATFVRVRARTGETITLTPGHLLYANGALVAAVNVRRGDSLTLKDGRRVAVAHVGATVGDGLFAPHTLHGDIVVDGVVASSFTEAMRPAVAHAMLAPLRAKAPVVEMVRQIVGEGRKAVAWVGRALIAMPRPAASM